MTIVPVNSVSGGTGTYTLAATDSLILGSAGMIYSSADNAITSLGANQFLVLNGTVLSDLKDGVHIEGGSSANMKVTVGSTGSIQAVDDGISIFGSGCF